MRAWAIALFFVAMTVTASAEPAPHVSDTPFDYDGIALGASLASVTAMPPPESGWRLICHADTYFGPQVQNCSYRDQAERIAPLRFDRSARRSSDHVLYFAADRVDGTPRLYEIMLIGEGDGATRDMIIAGFQHEIVSGLTARFGAPQENHAVANSAGFEPGNLDSLVKWQNTRGVVEVTGPNLSQFGLDRTIRVSYVDPDLAAHAFELRTQWRATLPATP
jgi:hypothetical protein